MVVKRALRSERRNGASQIIALQLFGSWRANLLYVVNVYIVHFTAYIPGCFYFNYQSYCNWIYWCKLSNTFYFFKNFLQIAVNLTNSLGFMEHWACPFHSWKLFDWWRHLQRWGASCAPSATSWLRRRWSPWSRGSTRTAAATSASQSLSSSFGNRS